MTNPDKSTEPQPSKLFTGRWREITIAVILSATAVAAAWSGFQASKWGGAMTAAFNEAAAQRTVAASDIAQASRDVASDRSTFSSFVLALASGDDASPGILFTEFRDEVQPLITLWLAEDPLANPDTESPFASDSYPASEILDDASSALEDAEDFTIIALEAKTNAGNYTLATVMFAIVLFLAGLSRQFEIRAATIGLASVSGILLTFGIGTLIWLPTLI